MELKTPLLKFLLTLTHLRVILCDTVYTGKEEKLEPLFKSAATEFIHHEVVTPVIFKNNRQLVSTFNQGGHHDAITIKINTTDNKLILDLKRNRNLFSKAYIEKSFTDKEKYQIKRPHHKKLQRHCFYHGHLRGVKHSMVALSTCQGISGYIHNGVEVFHIEPAFDIDKRSHRLYKDADSAQSSFTCGAHKYGHSTRLNETREIQHKNVVLKRTKRRVRKPYDANVNTRYVEMYIVNDFRTFDSNGRNLVAQIHHTQNIINIVSRLYQPFNIYIALTGIENWTVQDLFVITNEADSTLENFLHYRKNRINPKHHNDNAQLITGTTFANGVVGKAIKGTICTFQYSGGVNLNLATAGQTAATIAHELGHNFGMDHDNYTVCQCKEDKCIMAATSGGVNTPSRWSSCSMLSLQEAFEMGMDYCLRNKPESLYKGPVCGNGFTEEGEECDCGLLEECKNKCCNATTCRLTQGSTCATGACCDLDGCKPKPAATLCRPAAGECDLSEYCWGNNPYCPDDVYLEDGTDCSEGQSYCYNGTCKTHTGQCKLLWGGTGRVSDPVCFKHLNTNGSKHGNCGYNWTTSRYEPCQRDDVMCGLLHCVHQNEKLMFWKDNLAHATPATFLTIGKSVYICRGAILDVGLDMPDPGMVPDGAKCEDKKVCINHRCTPLSHLNSPKCTAGCSGRGQCNSRGHCHCEEGFGSPICNIAGNGGSIDSGPIRISDDKSLLIGLLVFFLVICPLLGLGAFIAYHFRDSLKAAWHQSFSQRHKGQSRPLRPQRPPPKREPQAPSFVNTPVAVPPPATANTQSPPYKDSPPAYANLFGEKNQPLRPKPAARNNNRNISGPTLTDSTHAVTKTHVQSSPVASHVKTVPNPPPKPPTKPVKQSNSQPMNVPKSSNAKKIAEKNDTPSDSKSKFGPIFKMPSFARSQDKETTPKTPKQEIKKQEEAPAANIVRKRELTREISSPVLISTTDRRSKHLVKLENLKVNVPQEDDSNTLSPPIPPHINLKSSESENTKKNCPLPPRPENDCAVEVETNRKKSRKSATESPSMNQRQPPAPPTFAKVNNTESTLQSMTDVLATLDDIQLELPDDVYVNETDSPKVMSKKPHNMQVKNIKPKPKTPISKSSSDSIQKKPMLPTKASAGKTKSDTKTAFNNHARPGVKGNQSATSKHGSSQSKPGSSRSNIRKTGKKSAANTAEKRKDSTDSLDDGTDEGVASVSGLTKMFEGQKKPLLSDDKAVKTTQGENKAPMTPPKPTHGAKPVKQIRSVNV